MTFLFTEKINNFFLLNYKTIMFEKVLNSNSADEICVMFKQGGSKEELKNCTDSSHKEV